MKIPHLPTLMLLIFLGLSACVPINGLFATPTATPTPTAEPCAYMWAYHTDETATALLQSLLAEQSLPFIPDLTKAFDFGEDCVTASGVNQGFGAMETDFSVVREITVETTDGELGEYAIAVTKLIAANFDRDKNMNGANRGYIEFILLPTGSAEQYHRIQIDEAIQLIEQGVTPEDFYKQYFSP